MNQYYFEASARNFMLSNSNPIRMECNKQIDSFFTNFTEDLESRTLERSDNLTLELPSPTLSNDCFLIAKKLKAQDWGLLSSDSDLTLSCSSETLTINNEAKNRQANQKFLQSKSYCVFPKGWNEEQDKKLLELGKQTKGAWKKIAKEFGNASIPALFFKNRFNDLTFAPPQRRSKFTAAEDRKLIKYFERYGPNWPKIAAHFENRTPIMIKNRYYSFIKKQDLANCLPKKAEVVEAEPIVNDDNNISVIENSRSPASSVCPCKFNSQWEDVSTQLKVLREQVQILQSLCLSRNAELNELKKRMNIETISGSAV